MRNTVLIFSFFLSALTGVFAQNQARFYAEANPAAVAVGEAIRVTFTLENAKSAGKFTPPDWDAAGFIVLGSSQSSSISIANGETTSSATYYYTITPAEAGDWIIPSVSIKTSEGELRSDPITVHATPHPDGIKPGSQKRMPARPSIAEPKKRIKTIKM
ncbi:MAG: BatD family protein [Saprospiraceae bacterium]|nr:BatD family protein [Saprospiraceae bacterium]